MYVNLLTNKSKDLFPCLSLLNTLWQDHNSLFAYNSILVLLIRIYFRVVIYSVITCITMTVKNPYLNS